VAELVPTLVEHVEVDPLEVAHEHEGDGIVQEEDEQVMAMAGEEVALAEETVPAEEVVPYQDLADDWNQILQRVVAVLAPDLITTVADYEEQLVPSEVVVVQLAEQCRAELAGPDSVQPETVAKYLVQDQEE